MLDRDCSGNSAVRKLSRREPSFSASTLSRWDGKAQDSKLRARRPRLGGSRTSRMGLWRRPGRSAAEDDEHHDRKGNDDEREKLRSREGSNRASRIAAIELNDEPGHTVQHRSPERARKWQNPGAPLPQGRGSAASTCFVAAWGSGRSMAFHIFRHTDCETSRPSTSVRLRSSPGKEAPMRPVRPGDACGLVPSGHIGIRWRRRYQSATIPRRSNLRRTHLTMT